MSENEVCYHCGLPVTGENGSHRLAIKGQLRDFCCSGCATVCQTIHDSGLDGFYQKVKAAELSPPPAITQNLEQYDLPEIQADFVVQSGNASEATLLVEGIHCAACVWLIERALQPMAGVMLAEVNLAHHRLRVRWSSDQIRLSSVMKRLHALGYSAMPYDPERAEGSARKQNRDLLYRMSFAGFGVANMMWITVSLYAGELSASKIELGHKHFFWWVALLLSTPVLLYSGWPFLRGAFKGLMNGRPTMDLPITIGVWTTYFYSVWVVFGAQGDVYFDVVVTFLFIILIGRYLEAMSRRNASSASARMLEMQPRSATLVEDDGQRLVSVRTLKMGDQVFIRPGEKMPVDGRVVDGASQVDESMLTGESRMQHKQTGDSVVAGSINGSGALVVEVEQLGKDTALAKIIHLVEMAQGTKAPIQCTTDRIVPWFVVATITLSALTFLYWSNAGSMDVAVMAAVSVLIITCPCAFGMATPMSVVVSVGHGAANGILVRNGAALETLARASHVIFDKTGTLTEGKMALTSVIVAEGVGMSEHEVLRIAAMAESVSEHAIAKAVVAYAQASGVDLGRQSLTGFTAIPGRGIEVQLDNGKVYAGNRRLMDDLGISIPASLEQRRIDIEVAMGVAVFVVLEGVLLALLAVQDKVRPGAGELVRLLRARGLGVTMLTGDSLSAANRVVAELAVDMNVIAEVYPQDKERVVREIQEKGHCVVMVGDGVNDAPALVRADVGIAMGTGTDVSMDCADIVLMGNDLRRIDFALDLARLTIRTIRQNIIIALAYNIILIPVAMSAKLTPIFASIAMPISSLLVIGNAIMIRRRCKALK